MSTVRCRVTQDDEVVHDETFVNDRTEIGEVSYPGIRVMGSQLKVAFSFDPPLLTPKPEDTYVGPREFAGLHVGQHVTVPAVDHAWEYGGHMPFGGTIYRFWPDSDVPVGVRFYAESEDGWGWWHLSFERSSIALPGDENYDAVTGPVPPAPSDDGWAESDEHPPGTMSWLGGVLTVEPDGTIVESGIAELTADAAERAAVAYAQAARLARERSTGSAGHG